MRGPCRVVTESAKVAALRGEIGMTKALAALFLMLPLTGCLVGAAVGVAGAVVGTTAGVIVGTTGAVIDAAIPDGNDEDDDDDH